MYICINLHLAKKLMIRKNNIIVIISTLLGLLLHNPAEAEQCLIPEDPVISHAVEVKPFVGANNVWIDANTIVSKNTKKLRIKLEGSMIYYPLFGQTSANKSIVQTGLDWMWGQAKSLMEAGYRAVTGYEISTSSSDEELKYKNAIRHRDEDIQKNQSIYKECLIDSCFFNEDSSACVKKGSFISDYQKEPCILEDGMGLLVKAVPNTTDYVQEDVKVFFIKLMPGQNYMSLKDSDIIPTDFTEMKLFIAFMGNDDLFKGSYNVHFHEEVNESYKFLSSIFKYSSELFLAASKKISQSLMANTNMEKLLLTLVSIYISISGFLFSTGIIKHNAKDMLKHYMKICIICALADINAATFFLDLAKALCVDGGKQLADMIMTTSMKIASDSLDVAAQNTSMLDVFDNIMDRYFSVGLHIRIWSLLTTEYMVFIPLAYAAIITFIFGCIRSAILYVISIFGFAFLFAITPIMICLVLSSFTKDLFRAWTRSIINCALINVFLSAVLGMFAVFLLKYATTPFDYIICNKELIENKYLLSLMGNAAMWQPRGDISVTTQSLIIDIVVMLTFSSIIKSIPDFVETIAPSIYNPLSESVQRLMHDKVYDVSINDISQYILLYPLRPVSATKECVNATMSKVRYTIDTSQRVLNVGVDTFQRVINLRRSILGGVRGVYNRVFR